MKISLIMVLFFLLSCSSKVTKNDFEISYDMNLDEFKNKLQQYGKFNPYPNIDN